MRHADWIAVDWGTTALRAWAMSSAGSGAGSGAISGVGSGDQALAEAASDQGMARLPPEGFEPALLDLVDGWLGEGATPVIACGMVGARQGWVEAPYAPVPCAAAPGRLTQAPTKDPRLDMRIVPGVSQSAPADVMRGEETQIAGYLAAHPDFDGVLCLPGTHTKWAHISAGEIVSFRSFMTGEIFALLGGQSVLRHSMDAGWDEAAFVEAVAEGQSHPARLAAELFTIRATSLLKPPAEGEARARLSGLLIGAELAGARPYWLGQEVALIGAPALTAHYALALALQGLSAAQVDSAPLTRAGLAAIYQKGL